MIFLKLFIGYIGFACIFHIIDTITDNIEYKKMQKAIHNMNPQEKQEWQEDILMELRSRAFRNGNYEEVDRISDLLDKIKTTKE